MDTESTALSLARICRLASLAALWGTLLITAATLALGAGR
jgi:hypothetical protein